MAEHTLDLDNLTPNSDASRNTNYPNPLEKKVEKKEEEPKPTLKKVVEGGVTKKEKKTFFGADLKEIGAGLVKEVIKPRIKDFAYDFVDTAMSRLLWHDDSRGRGRNYRSGYTAYSSGYSPQGSSQVNRPTGTRDLSRQEREEFALGEYAFDTRSDAVKVMDTLQNQVDQDGSVSVADYYALIGIDTQYQDHKWGWTDRGELRDMKIRTSHGAYLIVMPSPVPLNVTGMRR